MDQSDPRIKEIVNTYRNLIQKEQSNVKDVSKQMQTFCTGLAFFDIFLIVSELFIIILLTIKGITFLETFLYGSIFLVIIALDTFLLFMSFHICESKQENSINDFKLVFKVFSIIGIIISTFLFILSNPIRRIFDLWVFITKNQENQNIEIYGSIFILVQCLILAIKFIVNFIVPHYCNRLSDAIKALDLTRIARKNLPSGYLLYLQDSQASLASNAQNNGFINNNAFQINNENKDKHNETLEIKENERK